MSYPPRLVVEGTLLGSFILSVFWLLVLPPATDIRVAEASAKDLAERANPFELLYPGASAIPTGEMLAEKDETTQTSLIGLLEEMGGGEQAAELTQSEEQPEITESDLQAAACELSDRYPQKILQWCESITRYAGEAGLEPDLVAALILQESGGDSMAYSHSGAVGLMQVMPRDGIAARFMCKNGPCFSSRPTIAELQDPEYNLQYGTRMLAGLLGRTGDMREALRSYGPMDVGYGYADKVLRIFQNYGNP